MGHRTNDLLARELASAIQARIEAESDRRTLMVRAVLSMQWQVAIMLLDRVYMGEGSPDGWAIHPDVWACNRLAALPSPAEAVETMLKEMKR